MHGKLRESKGITQEQLSKKLGYKTKNTYSLKERGKRKFSLDESYIVAKHLIKQLKKYFLINK